MCREFEQIHVQTNGSPILTAILYDSKMNVNNIYQVKLFGQKQMNSVFAVT